MLVGYLPSEKVGCFLVVVIKYLRQNFFICGVTEGFRGGADPLFSFCNTTDKKVLSQVLNNYDQETTDFFRWKVTYQQKELSELITKRSGIDYGQILDLIPMERGTSGRLTKLKIVGTKRTLTIGKELEILFVGSLPSIGKSRLFPDRSY